jgi:hypothetical protein
MGVPGNANALLLKQAAAAGGYEISRSVRFNSSDSAFCSRTPASASNRKTWTWAGWVKRSKLGTEQAFFSAGNSSPAQRGHFRFRNIDALVVTEDSGGYEIISTQVFRDVGAWFHLVVAFDSTQSTSTDRIKVYINGSQITTFSTATYPTQNFDSVFNTTDPHRIGELSYAGNIYELDAYLADLHWIDSQALTPSAFGEFDTNGVWQPIAYSGSYGTNGFHLDFADNSTAAALGTDTSSNGNTWTVNNLSVTAGAGNDSLVDSPTNGSQTDTGVGGEVVGNYCTWNPLDKDSDVTLSNGNLDTTQSAAGATKGTVAVATGKWYWEITKTSTGNQNFGIATVSAVPSTYVGGFTSSAGFNSSNGDMLVTGSAFGTLNGSTVGTTNNGDVLGLALDLDGGTLKIYRNGTLLTANHFTISNAGNVTPAIGTNVSLSGNDSANFGQRPFAYTAPSGFKALCTTNLPTPTIADGSTVMDVALYTGNGSTQTISGLNFSPDLVWFKSRSAAENHVLSDRVRGADRQLFSNLANAEQTNSTYVTSFTDDGFSLGSNTGTGGNNINGSTYAAWCWDAGSSTVTNTQGSISSQVRANASAGFSVVTFTMGSGSYTVGHGLGVAPSLLITKARSNTSSWWTYHASLGTGSYLALNGTAAAATDYSWGAAPTSTVFTANNNFFTNAYTYVVYAFAPVAGYSLAFTYTGNGLSDGPAVFLGFKPALIIIKRTDSANDWVMLDNKRIGYNPQTAILFPNESYTESASDYMDLLAGGFKVRRTNAEYNASGGTYIGFAWAEHPFATARAR